MTTFDTSLKLFNTHQTTGESRTRFSHSSHQTLSAQALILKMIDHRKLHAYLIRNRVPHIINNHVHLAVTNGEKNEVMRQCYMLLTAWYDLRIHMNIQLLDEAGV